MSCCGSLAPGSKPWQEWHSLAQQGGGRQARACGLCGCCCLGSTSSLSAWAQCHSLCTTQTGGAHGAMSNWGSQWAASSCGRSRDSSHVPCIPRARGWGGEPFLPWMAVAGRDLQHWHRAAYCHGSKILRNEVPSLAKAKEKADSLLKLLSPWKWKKTGLFMNCQ